MKKNNWPGLPVTGCAISFGSTHGMSDVTPGRLTQNNGSGDATDNQWGIGIVFTDDEDETGCDILLLGQTDRRNTLRTG